MNKFWKLSVIGAFIFFLTFISPSIDLSISKRFYSPSSGFYSNYWLDFIFDYASYPALLTSVAACFFWIASYFKDSLTSWRAPCAVLVLTMAIGSGLLVHLVFKDHWGRPRPKQIIEFGGKQHFRAFYNPNLFNQPEPSKSFPCGHCSMGFYFFSLFFIGRATHRRILVYFGMLLVVVLGTALSFTRLAQGGHFFTDILFSALIMGTTAWASTRWAYKIS